jgi:hypothetical protein
MSREFDALGAQPRLKRRDQRLAPEAPCGDPLLGREADDLALGVEHGVNPLIDFVKATSLVSLVTISELTFSGRQMVVTTGRPFEVWALVLVLCFCMAYRSPGWSD